MTSESLGNLLAVPFEGRIVPHDDDPLRKYSDFIDKPTVVYPWSDAGLCHAIRIKQHLGHKGFLRSGLSSSGDGPLQGEGGLVVDFSSFARIEVRKTGRDGDGRITIDVEAGASTRQLADELIRNNAFLPLGDNPVQSVVASVLSGKPGRFDRSMGRLRDYVENLEVITPHGELRSFAKGVRRVRLHSGRHVWRRHQGHHLLRGDRRQQERRGDVCPFRVRQGGVRGRHPPARSPRHCARDGSLRACLARYLGVIVVSVEIAGKPADRDRMAAVLDQLTSYREGPAGEATATRIHRVEASSPAEIVELTDRKVACPAVIMSIAVLPPNITRRSSRAGISTRSGHRSSGT